MICYIALFEKFKISHIWDPGGLTWVKKRGPKKDFPHTSTLRLFFGISPDPMEQFDSQIELLQFTSRFRQNFGGLLEPPSEALGL